MRAAKIAGVLMALALSGTALAETPAMVSNWKVSLILTRC